MPSSVHEGSKRLSILAQTTVSLLVYGWVISAEVLTLCSLVRSALCVQPRGLIFRSMLHSGQNHKRDLKGTAFLKHSESENMMLTIIVGARKRQ